MFANILDTSIGNQILRKNIRLVVVTACSCGIINPFLSIQTYVAAVCHDLSYIHSRETGLIVATPGNKHIPLACCNIQLTGGINTQRAQVANDEFINDHAVSFHFLRGIVSIIGLDDLGSIFINRILQDVAVGIANIHFFRGIGSIIGSHRLFSVFNREQQDVPRCILHDNIVCICICELLQIGDGSFRSTGQVSGVYFRNLIVVHADPFGFQYHIVALHIGHFTLGLSIHAAFFIDNGIADCIEKLFLRPGIFYFVRIISVCQRLISCIRRKIFIRAGIGRLSAIRFCVCEHLRQRVRAFAALKHCILFFHAGFIIGRVLFQALNVGSFIVLGSGDQACIDPMADQLL